MEPLDPADLRITHADRERVAELLREAAGDGRIDLDELDQRLEATWAAKTYRDLVPITLDLAGPTGTAGVVAPRPAAAPDRRVASGGPTHPTSLAVLTETRRRGRWALPAAHSATAVLGSVVLDLREASFPDGEVVITANAVLGSVEIIVDARTEVLVQGLGVMGMFEEGRTKVEVELDHDSPVVRVTGFALMGSVEVKRRGAPGGLGRAAPRQLDP